MASSTTSSNDAAAATDGDGSVAEIISSFVETFLERQLQYPRLQAAFAKVCQDFYPKAWQLQNESYWLKRCTKGVLVVYFKSLGDMMSQRAIVPSDDDNILNCEIDWMPELTGKHFPFASYNRFGDCKHFFPHLQSLYEAYDPRHQAIVMVLCQIGSGKMDHLAVAGATIFNNDEARDEVNKHHDEEKAEIDQNSQIDRDWLAEVFPPVDEARYRKSQVLTAAPMTLELMDTSRAAAAYAALEEDLRLCHGCSELEEFHNLAHICPFCETAQYCSKKCQLAHREKHWEVCDSYKLVREETQKFIAEQQPALVRRLLQYCEGYDEARLCPPYEIETEASVVKCLRDAVFTRVLYDPNTGKVYQELDHVCGSGTFCKETLQNDPAWCNMECTLCGRASHEECGKSFGSNIHICLKCLRGPESIVEKILNNKDKCKFLNSEEFDSTLHAKRSYMHPYAKAYWHNGGHPNQLVRKRRRGRSGEPDAGGNGNES